MSASSITPLIALRFLSLCVFVCDMQCQCMSMCTRLIAWRYAANDLDIRTHEHKGTHTQTHTHTYKSIHLHIHTHTHIMQQGMRLMKDEDRLETLHQLEDSRFYCYMFLF